MRFLAIACLVVLCAIGSSIATAQQQPGWTPNIEIRGAIPDVPEAKTPALRRDPAAGPAANTTVVPRRSTAPVTLEPRAGSAQVSLSALLTAEGQRIDQGVSWRVYEDRPGPDGQHKLIASSQQAAPVMRLDPGRYLVSAAFGRAQLTRRITVTAGAPNSEQFVLNAGGLRLTAYSGDGKPAPANAVHYDIFSDERDQSGQRVKLVSAMKPGVIVRLNSGIYHVISTFGDANASVSTDVTVEAGKLTEASVAHATARVTLKLVQRAGGEALADTHWSIANAQGEVVKESVGALPTHTLAPGTYSVTAKQGAGIFRRAFELQMGQAAQVEVVAQ
jgi:preprotein translocase subunit YajC